MVSDAIVAIEYERCFDGLHTIRQDFRDQLIR
jgi:hypothetical protein